MRNAATGRREIAASEFKAHCLSLLDDVAGGHELVITKHGKPVARLVPVGRRNTSFGSWKGVARVTGEIVENDWSGDFEATRHDTP